MKKGTLFLIMMFILATSVFASSSVREAIDDLVAQNEDILIIAGDAANTNDILAATDIGILFSETKNKTANVKLVSEVSDISQPTVLIGGPCANPFTEEVMGITCATWPYQPGQGIVSSYEHNGQTVIVVAGTLEGDTRRMGKEFQKYETSSTFRASTTAVFGKAEVSSCGNDICETGETDKTCLEDCSDEKGIKLIATSSDKHSPRISGNNLIWTDRNNGIMLYKGSTGEVVTVSGADFADIDGDYVVDNNFKAYYIPTGQKTTIPGEVERLLGEVPTVFNDLVVFPQMADACESSLPCEVYLYDLNTNQKTKIFTANRPSGFSMYGDWIVYSDEPGDVDYPDPLAFPEIYAYNQRTGDNRRLTSTPRSQTVPQIYENIIVWMSDQEGDKEIYAYDLLANKEWRVTDSLSDQVFPMIDQNIITWVDRRNGNDDVYYCDVSKNGLDGGCLADDAKTRVTYSSLNQGTVDVSNQVLAWVGEVSAEVVPDQTKPYAGSGYTNKAIYLYQILGGGLPSGFVMPN